MHEKKHACKLCTPEFPCPPMERHDPGTQENIGCSTRPNVKVDRTQVDNQVEKMLHRQK